MSERAHTKGRDDLSPIDWIKKYRAIVGCDLREAKDAYDAGRPMPTSSAEIDAALERDAKRQALRDAAPDMFEALKAAERADKALDEREGYGEWEALDARARELRAAALSKASGEVDHG
jgi:hypothetical protein